MCITSHPPPDGHIPHAGPLVGATCRQPSVLWWSTHPSAPYTSFAYFTPATESSSHIRHSGSARSPSPVTSAGQ